MTLFDNETYRFGSAAFATETDAQRASMFNKGADSIFAGFFNGRALYWNGAGGVLITAGARGGKLRDLLAYSVCSGGFPGTLVVLDPKGELAAISRKQTNPIKACYYWNPRGLHGLPKHRINPTDYIRAGSPTLVSDVKVLCENLIPLSGAAQAIYFERRAREFMEAIILTIVKLAGALTLPRLYEVINLIPSNSDTWLDFAFEMHEAGFEISKRVEEEIADARGKENTGITGILGELFKAVAPLSDPILMESVSAPYDVSLGALCKSGLARHLYLMPPAEFISAWSPVLKAILVGAMIHKSRAPSAPRQTWIIDEAAQLEKFPLLEQMFSIGAGIGIRPVAVFQSTDQMKAIGPHADSNMTASAACRIYFAVRELASATVLSNMLGVQTLEYDDQAAQARARVSKHRAVQALAGGGDLMQASFELAHYAAAESFRSKQHRLLRTPDEILNTPEDSLYIFADGLPHPLLASRAPYYSQRSMAGRYHPNPYHPPLDRVQVKQVIGTGWRPIITQSVPAHLRHLPQYADGTWSYVEGFK